ncbi:hypothetical protein Micbo1qcDRAFT_125469, partial [Microdochium bolleyi]
AYLWLLSAMKRDSMLASTGADEMSAISNAVKRALQYKSIYPRNRYNGYWTSSEATFDVDWCPRKMVGGQNTTDSPHTTIRNVICLTGDFIDAQAMTCGEYLQEVWPHTGQVVLNCLEELLAGGSHSMVLDDCKQLFPNSRFDSFLIQVSGSPILICEISEQLAWLGAALRQEVLPGDGPTCCTPSISFNALDRPIRCTISFHLQKTPYRSARGSCWHRLFRHPLIARGFPIAARPPTAKGLELTLGAMAILTQARYLNIFGDKMLMKGFSQLVYPSSIKANTIGWHLLSDKDDNHLSYTKGLQAGPISISLAEVEQSRHILGWCSDAELHAGASDASYDIEASGLPLIQVGSTLKNALIRRGVLVYRDNGLVMGHANSARRSMSGSYTSNLQWLNTQRVLLWDTGDKRGWLVGGLSALLHMLRAYLHHTAEGPHWQNFLLGNNKIEDDPKGLTSNMAAWVLTSLQNRRKKLFSEENETLEDKIEHFYNVLDQLISYQDLHDATQDSSQGQRPRNLLEGWDLADFAASEDPIRPRVAMIPAVGRSWVDFVRAQRVPVLFGKGFGEIIRPSPSCTIAAPWHRVPVDQYYLTSLLHSLPKCEATADASGRGMLVFGEDAVWHGPGLRLENQSDVNSMRLGASAVVQVLLPLDASDEHRVLDISPSVSSSQAALIFGHNPAFSWLWGETGPPVMGEVPIPVKFAPPQQVRSDSGFWSASASATSEASNLAQASQAQTAQIEPDIGILCALTEELKAVRILFDSAYNDPVVEGDDSCYVSGSFGGYNVIASCIGYGPMRASNAFANLTRSFPRLAFCLMVGIGGGIPSETCDVRLGDVVVGTPSGHGSGIVQYDTGKARNGSIEETRLHFLQSPRSLIAVINRLRSAPFPPQGPLDSDITRIVEQNPASCDPGECRDILHRAGPTSNSCGETDDCCQIVSRPRRPSTSPVIHYGTIASGSLLIKDAAVRDGIGKRFGAICVEMEAAGLEGQTPCLVIRGICDYADAHKNDDWQEYAAASVAACAKYLLEESKSPRSPANSRKRHRPNDT